MRLLELYIHIPFCLSKCYYCDFVSYQNISEEKNGTIDDANAIIENIDDPEIQKELYDALSKNRVYVHYSIYNIKGSKSIFDDITQYLNSCKITPTVGKAIVLSNGKTTKFGENLISVKHGLSLPVFLKCCAIMRKVVY